MKVERAAGFLMAVVELDAKNDPKGFEEDQCHSNLLGTSEKM